MHNLIIRGSLGLIFQTDLHGSCERGYVYFHKNDHTVYSILQTAHKWMLAVPAWYSWLSI